jgi:thiol:disulfide interchange protein
MQPFRWRAGFVVLATMFVHAHALAEDKVEVKVAKYGELTDTIKKLKGKVIVVDFWADW